MAAASRKLSTATTSSVDWDTRAPNHLRIRHDVERFVQRREDSWPYKNVMTLISTAELALAPVMLLLEGSVRHADPLPSSSYKTTLEADGQSATDDGHDDRWRTLRLPLVVQFASNIFLVMSAIVGLYACRKRANGISAMPALTLFAALALIAAAVVLLFSTPPVVQCLFINREDDSQSCWTIHFVGAVAWTVESLLQAVLSVALIAICLNALCVDGPRTKRSKMSMGVPPKMSVNAASMVRDRSKASLGTGLFLVAEEENEETTTVKPNPRKKTSS